MLLQRHHSRVCRKKYKSNSLNELKQRVFKTAPLFAVTNPEPTATPELLALFTAFFESLWAPSTNPDGSTVQKAGMSYVYDEDGTLIAQTLTGGATSSWGQSARYIYLPTASGPMLVAAIYGTKHYAIQSDHLNTPRRLIQSDGQVAWQWAYSAFGEEKPTIAKTRFANADLNQSFGSTTVPAVTFNLRYPGQYFDQESGLHYNYHRSYSATTGRYTQSDPIGLDGGWNRFGYANQNALSYIDPDGKAALLALCATNPAAALACAGGAVGAAAYALPGVKSGIDAIIKFCAPDDPCAALLKTVSAKAADVRRQYFANMTDAKDLYNKAYCQPDLGKRSGSWIGHEQKLRNLIESLRTAITAADAAGCAVNAEDRKLLLLEIPYCPAK